MLHVKDIAVDWVQVGTMLVVSQWLSGGGLSDSQWMQSSLFTILGFTAYHLSTRNFLGVGLTGQTKMVADDWIKVGTMLVVSRLLGGGGLSDPTWLAASMATLLGFTAYDIVTSKYVQGKDLTYNPKLQNLVNTWAKVGTMLVVSRLISCESIFNPAWMMGSLGVLIGFTMYDVGTSHVIDRIFA